MYSEAILKPYMPLDGQLICLQQRLMRAARAFLDPDLQAGKITPEQAKRLLVEDVVLSETLANQEVDRYTFRSPGQIWDKSLGAGLGAKWRRISEPR